MMRLMTASLGPEDRGRGYGVLRHTLDDALMARAGPLLGDFSLSLAAWADLAAPAFAAVFPLDDSGRAYALCRAGYLGRAELGTVAVANVAILPESIMSSLDGRSDRLLVAIPPADGRPFGHERLDLSAVSFRGSDRASRSPMRAFGLEWRDHVLEVDESCMEEMLSAALASISPAVQRRRVRGWCTTSALVVSGGFDPGVAFQLVLRSPGQPIGAALAGHRIVKVRNGQVAGAPDPEPDAWRAWSVIKTLTDRSATPAPLAWRPQDQALPVHHVVALTLLQAALPLEPRQRVALIAQAVANATTPADLRPAMLRGAGDALARIIRTTEAASEAGWYLEATLGALGPDDDDAAAAMVSAVPTPDVLEGLSKQGRQAMIKAGGLTALAEASPDWRRMQTSTIRALVEACSELLVTDPAARRLIGPLLNDLSMRGVTQRRVAVGGLSAWLATQARDDDVTLATAAVSDLATDLSPADRRAYASRALIPILSGEVEVGRATLLNGLKAAVSLV